MPWTTPELEKLSEKAKKLLKKEFSREVTATIFLTNREEMTQRVIDELEEEGCTKENIRILSKLFIPNLVGKYFRRTNEILVVTGIGENVETILHEYLHAIQKCEPNREGIVDYITYKITGNNNYIDTYDLKDWEEIERANTYKKIKNRLVREGDCEEF